MDLLCYYFPNYHADSRNEAYHGKGWTEWELMKCARSRFHGHKQPKIPQWGYEDEADPAVMAKKISAARSHGIDGFIFDWYWYDGPYLQRALDEGFLAADNSENFKFALMWANHDWIDRHPIGRNMANAQKLYPWTSTRDNIGEVWDYIIEKYLTRPNYYRLNGIPYFSIYATNRFITQMGGPSAAAEVLAELRSKVKAADLPGIHINAVWYDNLDNNPQAQCTVDEWKTLVGFDSYTSYNCTSDDKLWTEFPTVDFREVTDLYMKHAVKATASLPAPYFPVVTTGWDVSPRTIQSEIWEGLGYPFMPVMESDPEAFGEALHRAAELDPQLIFINAWNEWTEGSYLEPDQYNGMAMLEKIKDFKINISNQ